LSGNIWDTEGSGFISTQQEKYKLVHLHTKKLKITGRPLVKKSKSTLQEVLGYPYLECFMNL